MSAVPLTIVSTFKLTSGPLLSLTLVVTPCLSSEKNLIGHLIPLVGLGVFENTGPSVAEACLTALEVGYRYVLLQTKI